MNDVKPLHTNLQSCVGLLAAQS